MYPIDLIPSFSFPLYSQEHQRQYFGEGQRLSFEMKEDA